MGDTETLDRELQEMEKHALRCKFTQQSEKQYNWAMKQKNTANIKYRITNKRKQI